MFKSCLGKVIGCFAVIFLSMVLTVGVLFAGYIFVKDEINAQFNPTSEELQARTEKFIDISEVPSGYSVKKAVDMAGLSAVITEYPSNNQVMAVIDPGWLASVDSRDISGGSLEKKIEKYLPGTEKGTAKLEQSGFINAFDQNIPAFESNFKMKKTNGNAKNFKALFATVKNPSTGKDNLILTFNDVDKYDRTVAEQFFKKVKFKRADEKKQALE